MTREGHGALLGFEAKIHALSMEANRQVLEHVVNTPGAPVPGDAPRANEVYAGTRDRDMLTLFGRIRLKKRAYYHLPTNKKGNPENPKSKKHRKQRRKWGRFPVDEALGLIAGATPEFCKRALEHAADAPFDKAAASFAKAYSPALTDDILKALVRALCEDTCRFARGAPREEPRDVPYAVVLGDGKGIPMRPEELAGVQGRGADGRARTREVKVGAVFEMHPVPGRRHESERLPDSTTHVATLLRKNDYADLLRCEFMRRFPRPPKVTLFLADGAPWLWDIRRTHFPQAIEILDFYHACEHLKPLLELAGLSGAAWTKQFECWKNLLLAGHVTQVIQACEALAAGSPPERAEKWREALNYYRVNQCRMKYDDYEAQGWFIGSGVVESACRTLVGSRFAQSGMRWSFSGAEAMLPIRTALLSGRYDELWDFILKNRKERAAA
jgi:hypothetical protein